MSKLSAFLNPVQVEETREVVISDRFQEGGRAAPFVIRAIRQEDNSRLIRAATRRVKDRDGVREELDSLDYNRRLVMACVVQPPWTTPSFAGLWVRWTLWRRRKSCCTPESITAC